jgi:transcriptional regulator with XRE-family HTH domain
LAQTFGEKLKILRVSLPGSPSLEKFGEKLGVNKATLSRYENGDTEPTVSFLQQMVDVYGEVAATILPGSELREKGAGYVTGALPEHIAEAWSILHEAARAADADLMAMDVQAVGEMLGAAAEAAGQGRGAEARLRAVRRAETILRAMGKGRP